MYYADILSYEKQGGLSNDSLLPIMVTKILYQRYDITVSKIILVVYYQCCILIGLAVVGYEQRKAVRA